MDVGETGRLLVALVGNVPRDLGEKVVVHVNGGRVGLMRALDQVHLVPAAVPRVHLPVRVTHHLPLAARDFGKFPARSYHNTVFLIKSL